MSSDPRWLLRNLFAFVVAAAGVVVCAAAASPHPASSSPAAVRISER